MKVSRAKFFMVVFLSSIDVIIPGSVLISRFISQPKDPQTWKKVNDSFVVPSSACYQGRIGTGSNYCNESCTKDDSKEQYSCDCPWKSATVTYVNNTWMCLENKMVRKKLGCAINNLFHYEREWHDLYTLSTQPRWGRKTTLYNKEASCVLNTSSSWVIGCRGEKTPVDNLTNRTKKIFVLGWSNKSNAYYIKVVDPIAIFRGRIINLGVSCSQPPSDIKEGCLLFKLEGNITCPVEYSMGSTLSTATSSLELTSSPANPTTTGTKKTTYSTQKTSVTESSNSKAKRDAGTNGVVIGIAAGCAVVVIIFFSFLVLLCKRRKSKNNQQESNTAVEDPVVGTHDLIQIERLIETSNEQDSQSTYQGLVNCGGQGNGGAGHNTADDNSGNCHIYQSMDMNTPATAAPVYENMLTPATVPNYQNEQTLEGGTLYESMHNFGSQTESAYEPLKGSDGQNVYERLDERRN